MEMLGMQDYSFSLGYCSSRDFNLNASCSTWPLNIVDMSSRNGLYEHYGASGLAPPTPVQHLVCKEMLKQTMLNHDAILRNQIQELHRLYYRQRELMDEMKRNVMQRHHLRPETLQSNPILQKSFQYSQRTCQISVLPWLNRTCSQLSISGAKSNNLDLNHVEENAMEALPDPAGSEDCAKESQLLISKCKKVGKKILDLELPAYEYIDSEEDEVLDWDNRVAEDMQMSCIEPPLGRGDVKLVFLEDDTQVPLSVKAKCLADLIKPIKLEEGTDSKLSGIRGCLTGSKEIPCNDLYGKTYSVLQVQRNEVTHNSQASRDSHTCQNVVHLDMNSSPPECLFGIGEAGQSGTDLNSSPEVIHAETLPTSSEGTEILQARENSNSYLLDQISANLECKSSFGLESSPGDLSLDDSPGEVAAGCTYTPNQLIPLADVMEHETSLVSSWRRRRTHDFVRAPIVVQALPCFSATARFRGTSKVRSGGDRSRRLTNLRCGTEFSSANVQSSFYSSDDEYASGDNGSQQHIKGHLDVKSERDIDLNSMSLSSSSDMASPGIWIDGENKLDNSTGTNGLAVDNRDKNFFGNGFFLDLNSRVNEDEFLLTPSPSVEFDLEAPPSPDPKECSPVRGESDDNQLETSSQLSRKENQDLLEELVRIAAEALVSISSSEVQTCVERATIRPSKGSPSDSLGWFARIVSSVVDDPASEFGVVLSCEDSYHCSGHLSHEIDYFEAMTLQLKETVVEEYCCKINVQNAETCLASLSSQTRRGRTRRQQQKDFQSEILPSLASLSRYEVTEDLQAIGGLIEATQTGWGRAGRNAVTRRRRRRPAASSTYTESTIFTPLKRQTGNSDTTLEERSPISWGKITRRRRGPRCPATNHRLILGQA